jgi:peptidoglycan/LPS O-acetylase OafA/YrhL
LHDRLPSIGARIGRRRGGTFDGMAIRTESGVARHQRLVYVDWLRALALCGVIVIHVCEVFNPWDEWHITNAERSRVAGEIVVLMAPWIMPLFMALAGVSAYYSLARRSNRAYVRERVLRVLVPLVVGTLLLVPPQVYAERVLRGQFTGSFIAFYPHFFDGIYPAGNLSWHHLWFLAHLFGYALITLPLFRFWAKPAGARQLAWLARVCAGPRGLVLLALPLVLERHLLWWLFPERQMLTADWSNHALLFVAYVYGYILAAAPWLGADIDVGWRAAGTFALATAATLIALTWTGFVPARLPQPYSGPYLAFWALYAVGAWAWIVALIGAARRYLRRGSPALDYGVGSGYLVYLVHQPVIVGVAFYVVQWSAPVYVKLPVLLVLSVAGTVAATELVRRVPGFRMLFGSPAPHRPLGPPAPLAAGPR